MSVSQVRSLVGKRCAIRWTDRHGNEIENVGLIQEVRFVPMYGAYVITPADEVSLDKVIDIEPLD